MHDFLQYLTSLPWDQAPQWLFLIPALLMLLAAAAEAAVGLAIIIQLHRRLRTVNVNKADQLKG